MALTNKRKAFIEEYLIDFNATQAAIRAGYSEKTAHAIGWENLRIPEIDEEIQRRIADKTMSADEVLIRLGDQARGTMEDFGNVLADIPNAFWLDLAKAERRGKLHLIKKLKFNPLGKSEIELYDAQAALVHIGKHHGLFRDITEISIEDGTIPVTYQDYRLGIDEAEAGPGENS